ncbi:MAG: hypothetical protein LBF37_04305 [Rickettsiales bacterium]|nr:hypothetical protein [Rickettsiales bacterium]
MKKMKPKLLDKELLMDTLGTIPEASAYIGGWTAANHWGLLDDFTIYTFVFSTEKPTNVDLVENRIEVALAKPHMFYGITQVDGAPMSDIHKTLIDAFIYPNFFGGEDVLDEMVENYFLHPDNDIEILKVYSLKAKNAVLAKKISILVDHK